MNNQIQYEKDENQNEIYPQVNGVDQILLNRYARDKDQIPFYPRDAVKNEFLDPKLGLIERGGEYVYPQRFLVNQRPRKPIYRHDSSLPKKEIYEKINGQEIIGRGLDGQQYYATDENGDEYYPENNIPARKADGSLYYARKADKIQTVFPKNADGDEFYLTFIDPLNLDTIPDRYAHKKNGDEIYPQRRLYGNLISDYILKSRGYAKRGGKHYYPKDGYNNEFYVNPVVIQANPSTSTHEEEALAASDVLLDTYAITNDGKIILPDIGGKHFIDRGKSPYLDGNQSDTFVLGKLVREENGVLKDFLTNVDVPKNLNVKPMKYRYLNLRTNIYKTIIPSGIAIPFFKTWYFWVFVIILLILKSYAIWWFFFKNKESYRVN